MEFEISRDVLHILPAAANESEPRKTLRQICFRNGNAYTTNRHILVEMEHEGDPGGDVCINKDRLKEIMSVAPSVPGNGCIKKRLPVRCVREENTTRLETGDVTMKIKPDDIPYPGITDLIPKGDPVYEITFSAELLMTLAKMAVNLKLSAYSGITFRFFKGNNATLFAINDGSRVRGLIMKMQAITDREFMK